MSNFFFQNIQRYLVFKAACKNVTRVADAPRRQPNFEIIGLKTPDLQPLVKKVREQSPKLPEALSNPLIPLQATADGLYKVNQLNNLYIYALL